VAFVADGEEGVVIGLAEQLIGREALGADGFVWCGNILPLALTPAERHALLPQIEAMVQSLTRRLRLRGVNGVDLVVARDDGGPTPYLVEVNPRYTASMELVERAYDLNVFSLHREAMVGRLPTFSLGDHLDAQEAYVGKGIVYARRDVTMPETASWAEKGRRDVPFPGERIEAGHPVCTVLTEGANRAACWDQLVARAEDVWREIGDG
jgi:predicted ATP-grasp superfamily ATP-dependent carboligase